jgi:dihydroorotase
MKQTFDLVIHNGRLVLSDGIELGGVGISHGRIAALLRADSNPRARRVIDARGQYIMPGFIDAHVHFRTPGLTHKEDWTHASRAAAAGGVTTVLDMPNTQPALVAPEKLPEHAALIEGQSLVDYGFHLGADPNHPERLDTLKKGTAASIKVFMAGHHTAPHVVRDPAALDTIFARAAERSLRVLLHAEDESIFTMLDAWRGPVRSYADFEPSRPRSGAIVAVAKIIELVRRHGTQAHVLHVSSREEVDLLSAARASGLPVTFEVTAHHLSFTDHDVVRLGSRIRLSPAIREPADRERLWRAIFAGEVATVGSDHAPHTMEEKLRAPEAAPPGIPGVQELVTALYTGLRRRQPEASHDEHISIVARLCAENPAAMFGLGDRKGRLAVGLDADVWVFDTQHSWSLRADQVKSKCGWSAYEGWMMAARAAHTVRRGEVIWDAEAGTFGEPNGRWIGADVERQRPVQPAQQSPSVF